MKGRMAVLLLVLISVGLAVLLLTDTVKPATAGIVFAASLTLLGLASRGFRRTSGGA